MRLNEKEIRLLQRLVQSDAYAMACDGNLLPIAHDLEGKGLIEWRGDNWGSKFFSATDAGRKLHEEKSRHV